MGGMSPWGIGLRVGIEMVSALVVAVAIGYGLDYLLGTKPILTAVFVLLAPWIMHAFGYGSLAVGLSRVLFPIVVLLGLTGIVVGVLNSYEHFSVPAIAPVFWNLAIVAGMSSPTPCPPPAKR